MIFINGDSYSAPFKSITKVWGDHLSDITKKSVINHAMRGSNNDRIFRSSIDYLNKNSCELVILATSFMTREEFWDNAWDFKHTIHDEEQQLGSKFITSQFNKEKFNLLRHRKLHDIHKPIMDYYLNVYLFTLYCRSKGIKYFIFPAADNYLGGQFWDNDFLIYLKNLTFYNEVIEDKNIWDIDSFCVKGWAETNNLQIDDSGHLTSSQSHKILAEYLYNERIKYII